MCGRGCTERAHGHGLQGLGDRRRARSVAHGARAPALSRGPRPGREGLAEEGGRYSWTFADGTREDGSFVEVDNSTLLRFTFGKDVLVKVQLMLTSRGVLVDVHQHAQRSDAENLALALSHSTVDVPPREPEVRARARRDLRDARPDVEGLVNV